MSLSASAAAGGTVATTAAAGAEVATQASRSSRVLSIQSHVVHGYVGNKSATFPLQLLGLDVDPVNAVHFSNHTGYPGGFAGDVLKGEQLWKLYEKLRDNGLATRYSHVLTGYIGSVDVLRTVVRVVQDLRNAGDGRGSRAVPYFCDPVLGDNGKCYVPQALVEVYKSEVVPVATVLTPNQFECELLTGIPIRTSADVARTFAHFHRRGVRTVVITSLEGVTDGPFAQHLQQQQQAPSDGTTSDGGGSDGSGSSNGREKIFIVASHAAEAATADAHGAGDAPVDAAAPYRQLMLAVPRIPAYFTGTGDLTTALLLAWLHKADGDLGVALERACASIQAVLRRTWQYTKAAEADGEAATADKELRLVQSAADIVNPPVEVKCHPFSVPLTL